MCPAVIIYSFLYFQHYKFYFFDDLVMGEKKWKYVDELRFFLTYFDIILTNSSIVNTMLP